MRGSLYHAGVPGADAIVSLDFRQTRADRPAETVRPEERPAADEGGGRVLACAACRRPVTTTAARIEVDGAHEHTFANPAGFQFRIGCFSRAPGVSTTAEPSTYWSWFPGHSWQVELCAACGEHLGWLFRGDAQRFHGLILDHLVEVDDEG